MRNLCCSFTSSRWSVSRQNWTFSTCWENKILCVPRSPQGRIRRLWRSKSTLWRKWIMDGKNQGYADHGSGGAHFGTNSWNRKAHGHVVYSPLHLTQLWINYHVAYKLTNFQSYIYRLAWCTFWRSEGTILMDKTWEWDHWHNSPIFSAFISSIQV